MNLEYIILDLISKKKEGEYWDFKEKHHESRIELLHDIICMANSLYCGNRYIIYGVEDDTYSIKGISEDSRRLKQVDIIDFLRGQKFAGGYRPIISMETIRLNDKELDILIIEETPYVPYYLTEDKSEKNYWKTT